MDTETLMHARNGTLTIVKNVVSSFIDSVYPFVNWLHTFFVFTILTFTLIIIIVVTIRLRYVIKEHLS